MLCPHANVGLCKAVLSQLAVEHLLPLGMFEGPSCCNIPGSCTLQHRITGHACPLAQDLSYLVVQLQLK